MIYLSIWWLSGGQHSRRSKDYIRFHCYGQDITFNVARQVAVESDPTSHQNQWIKRDIFVINVGAWRSVSLFGCYSTGSETVRHDEDGRAPFFFATETYFPLLQSFQL